MSNTLTAVLPSIFAGLDLVSRELVGIAAAAQRDASIERAAVGQKVIVPVAPPATGGNITPASNPPDDGDQALGSMELEITKSKYSPVRWNGEEERAIGPMGVFNKILADQFAQSMRWLVNQVEVDGLVMAYQNASRALGTPGTVPFGTPGDLTGFALVNRLLDENGAPGLGRRLIVGSAARFNLEGKQSVLFKANESGDGGKFLHKRIMPMVQNIRLGFSAGVQNVAAGTGSGYLVNNPGGYPAASTEIAVDTGSGTIPVGTIVTFANDPNLYVARGLAGGILTIAAPGLRQSVANDTAITLGTGFTANVAFTENALVLLARAPALPEEGDSADDRLLVVDPLSGIPFEIALYREYRRARYEVALAWGWSAVKREHICILQS
jgi:hypothetical protein